MLRSSLSVRPCVHATGESSPQCTDARRYYYEVDGDLCIPAGMRYRFPEDRPQRSRRATKG